MSGRGMRRGMLGSASVLLAACALLEPQPDRTQFFVLRSLVELGGPSSDQIDSPGTGRGLALGVGPIQLPAYLDRPQLVRRQDGNRVEIGETARWAEPLASGFTRVLAENLSVLLSAEVIRKFPWSPGERLDHAVRVDVRRFEPGADGIAELSARWSVRKLSDPGEPIERARDTNIRVPIDRPDSESAVTALSEALAQLSREVAETIRDLGAVPQETDDPVRAKPGPKGRAEKERRPH